MVISRDKMIEEKVNQARAWSMTRETCLSKKIAEDQWQTYVEMLDGRD